MNPTASLFLLSLFLVFNLNDARNAPAEDYWKSVMKEQPIPETIKDLFAEDAADGASVTSIGGSKPKKNHFVKNFDTRTIAVIYARSHGDAKKTSNEFKGDEKKAEKSLVPTHTKDNNKN